MLFSSSYFLKLRTCVTQTSFVDFIVGFVARSVFFSRREEAVEPRDLFIKFGSPEVPCSCSVLWEEVSTIKSIFVRTDLIFLCIWPGDLVLEVDGRLQVRLYGLRIIFGILRYF